MINEKFNVYNYGEYIEKLEIENARLRLALEHLYEESSKFNAILQQTELMNEAYSALHPEVNG